MFQQTPQKRVLFPRTLTPVMVGGFLACLVLFSLAISLLTPARAAAANATNNTINFQARLQTNTGAIVPDGYYNVQFKLYDGDTAGGAAGKGVGFAGTNLWTETWYDSNGVTAGNDNRVRVQNGYLTVSLGSQTAFPSTINWDQGLWLTMNIGGTTQTASPTWDGEMNPRLKLTATPYALRAGQLAAYNSASDLTSTLSILQPTGGNQLFQLADQGAAGTYTICIQNSASCGFAKSDGTTGTYIQNQNAGAQATSNFWISGTGRADTALQAPSFDTPTAVALNIGTTNATSITLGKSGVNTVVGGNLSVGTTQSFGAITVANGAWITGVDSSGSGNINMFSVNSNNQIQVGAALNVDGGIVLPSDSGPVTLIDEAFSSGITAGTANSYTLGIGQANALTVYGENDGSGNAQNVRVGIGSSITPGFTLDVGGDINLSGGLYSGGSQIITSGKVLQGVTANASILTSGTVSSSLLTGSYTGITGVGTLTAGTWNASTIGVGYGGTGLTTATSHGILYGNGTSALGVTAAGTSGQILQANASGVPGFVTMSGDVTIAAGGATAIGTGKVTTTQILDGTVSGTDIANNTITNSDIASGSFANITGVGTLTVGTWNASTIAAQYGGTGINGATAANGSLLIGNGSGYTLANLTAGTGVSITNGAGSITINSSAVGTAGGDLTGSYPNPTIASLQGSTLTITTPTGGNILQFNGTAWVNQSVSGDITIDSTGVATIGTGVVTGTKIANNTITNTNLASGSFGNITGTGALTSGSIASGFGIISTDSNITTSVQLQGGSLKVGNTAGQQVTVSAGAGNHGMEIGRTDGTASNPYVDFHSGATATDYDARISSSGGSGASGGGTLTVTAVTTNISGTLQVGGSSFVNSSRVVQGGATWNGNAIGAGYGGTGLTTVTTNGILYGNGTSAMGVTAAGTSGQILQANASGVPGFVSMSGDVTIAAGGATTIGSGAVTGTKIANNTITNTNLQSGAFSNITGTGALSSGSIASGFGTISTGNTITGTTLNGTTGVNTGAGAGTQRIDSSGNLVNIGNINGGIFNKQYLQSSDSNPHNYKIATLPATTSGTYDHLHLIATLNNNWNSTSNSYIDATFANRSGFTYSWTLRGATVNSNASLKVYNNGGAMDVYLSFTGAATFTNASYTVMDEQNETVYASPTDVGATPTGTLAFDASSASYPPSTYISNSGTMAIGSTGSTYQLDVQGGNGINSAQGYWVGGTQVLTSGRVLQNVTADASILTSGTISSARISGSYTGITGVGTLTVGTWNASTIGVTYGGTGVNGSTAANGSLLIGNGSGYTLATLTAGTGISINNAAGAITINATGAAGAAGGDLTGTYPNPTIASLQGSTLTLTTPTSGNFLEFNGTAWVNQSVSGDITIDSTGVASIGTGKVTSAMILDGTVSGTDIANNTITNTDLQSGSFGNITGTGALSSGSIASGFGTISTGNTITGTTLNGTIGVNTGAGAGTQRIDSSGNLVNIGNVTSTGKISTTGDMRTGNQNTISFTRTLPTTVSNEVDLGSFAFANGGGNLKVDVTVPSSAFSMAKQYIVPVYYNATANVWQIVQPVSDTGAYSGNNIALEINVSNGTASLRLDRTAGTTAGTAYVTITQQGIGTDAFTASSATTAITAPTVYYGAAIAGQSAGTFTIQGGLTIANSGGLTVGGQQVLTSGRVLQNVTADASILTSGTISSARISGSYTGITGVGTLTVGTWNASTIGAQYGGTGVNGATAANGSLLIGNGSGYTLGNLGGGSGISITNGAGTISVAVDSTVCRTTNNCTAVGTAGGDLTGSYPNPTIASLQGSTLTLTTPATGNFLQFNGTAWVNQSVSGDITISSTGVAAIGTGKVTTTQILDGTVSGTDIANNTITNSDIASGAFSNITGTGALSSGSIASGFGTISTSNTITGTTLNGTTGVNTGAGAGTQRIDASGNLVNINNITAGGNVQQTGASATNYFLGALGLGTANPQSGSALTVANNSWITSVDAAGSGYVNMFQVNAANQIQVGAALNVDGGIVLPTNGGQLTLADMGIDANAANSTPESYTLRVGSTNALTVYGESDGAGGTKNVRVAVGSSIAPAYTLDVGGDINLTGGLYSGGSQIITSGKVLQGVTANATILTTGTLSSSVVSGSYTGITGVGTLTVGTWNATVIGAQYGGTGLSTVTSHGILYGNGTSALGVTAAGTSGQVLIANASGVPTFATFSGDVSTVSATGAITIANSAITSAKILDGTIADADLSTGTFTHVTGTGALSSGSIASGFGTISTGNNITTTATVQGGTVTATTAIQGPSLDTASAGTLSIGTAQATTINIATNAVAHTIAIANGAAAQGVTVGSTNSSSSLTLQAGTSGVIVNSPTITTKDLVVGAVANTGSINFRMLQDDFETGDLVNWAGADSGTGVTIGTTTSPVHNGGYAVSIANSASKGSLYSYITSSSTVYGRAYFNVGTLGNPTNLMDFGTSSPGQAGNDLIIYLGASGDICYASNLSGTPITPVCSTTAPTTSAWHKLETRVTEATSTTGVLQVWLDGNLISSLNLSTLNLGTTAFSYFSLGSDVSTASTGTSTVYFDDVSVDTVPTGDSSTAYVQDGLHVSGSTSVGTLNAYGQNNAGNSIETTGGIDTQASYSVGGQSGLSSNCSNGQGLNNVVVSGGIIVGGSCGNAASTLQNAYDNTSVGTGGTLSTPALVNQWTFTTGGPVTSATVTMSGGSVAGHLLIVTVGTSGTPATETLTGYNGGTANGSVWHLAAIGAGSSGRTRIQTYYCYNCAVTTSVQVNFSASMYGILLHSSEYSGVQTSSDPLESSAGGNGSASNSTTQNSPTITTVNNNDLIYASLSVYNGTATTASTPSGFAALTSPSPTSKYLWEDYIASAAAGSYHATWTTNTSNVGGVATLAFKAAQTGGGANASILLADAKDYVITAPDTTTDPNVLVNLQCRTGCSTSQGRWAVQSGGVDALSVLYDTSVSITTVRIQSGVDIKIAADAVGAPTAQSALTHDFTCTSSESVHDIVTINTSGNAADTTTNVDGGVFGVIVAKANSTTCTVAFSGIVQVNGGGNTITIGDAVQSTGTAGVAQASTRSPGSQNSIGVAISAKDGSNLFWALLH